jgi:hypothetical protein
MGKVLGNHWGKKTEPLYRTTAGPKYGPFRCREAPKTIDVLDAASGEVIGKAHRLDEAPAGVAMWRLFVRDVEIDAPCNVVYRGSSPTIRHPRSCLRVQGRRRRPGRETSDRIGVERGRYLQGASMVMCTG